MASNTFGHTVTRFFRNYLAVIGTGSPLGRLMQRAMTDPEQRGRLVSEPAKVFEDAGIKLPEGLQIEVLENTESVIHLVLPPLSATDASSESGR